MPHKRDKPSREKRKPKKDKLAAKPARGTEVLEHVVRPAPEESQR